MIVCLPCLFASVRAVMETNAHLSLWTHYFGNLTSRYMWLLRKPAVRGLCEGRWKVHRWLTWVLCLNDSLLLSWLFPNCHQQFQPLCPLDAGNMDQYEMQFPWGMNEASLGWLALCPSFVCPSFSLSHYTSPLASLPFYFYMLCRVNLR